MGDGDFYPSNAEIFAALERFCAWDRVSRSAKVRMLARYLVGEVLAGRGDQIKSVTIASDIGAQGKPVDANAEALVRILAGRLREFLAAYYASEGASDPVRIVIPLGSYRPIFEVIHPVTPAVPVVEHPPNVLPENREEKSVWSTVLLLSIFLFCTAIIFGTFYYNNQNRSPYTASIADLKTATTPVRPVGVQERHTEMRPQVMRMFIGLGDSTSQAEMAALLSVREVAVRFGDFIVELREEKDDSSRHIWPEDYRLRLDVVRFGNTERFILSAIRLVDRTVVTSKMIERTGRQDLRAIEKLEREAANLLQARGPVVMDYRRQGDHSPLAACMLLSDAYFINQTDETHAEARRCANKLHYQGLRDPRLYTVSAFMDREEFTDRRNLLPGDPLKRALASALSAVELGPRDAKANYVLMTIYALTGDVALMIQTGQRALELNPLDSIIIDGFASRLNYVGMYQDALRLLDIASELQSIAPAWRDYAYFLAHLGLGNLDKAFLRITPIAELENPLYIVAAAIMARAQNNEPRRLQLLERLRRIEPDFFVDPRAMYKRRYYRDGLIDLLLSSLGPLP